MNDPVPNTVLVIDDDARMRKTIARMVTTIGYEVLEAADGSEGIHLFGSNADRIVAITLDLTMPTTNGRETLAMLSELAPLLPIVISSGLDPHAERLRGRIPGTPGVGPHGTGAAPRIRRSGTTQREEGLPHVPLIAHKPTNSIPHVVAIESFSREKAE
jgi:CheY-like chemotaxis protein